MKSVMEDALKALNAMEKDGVLERYAIGGAVAALFYSEPSLTYDLDIFVFLPEETGKLLSLAPIYRYLKGRGYKEEKEHILIGGMPVQLIPAYNALVEEALRQATDIMYGRTKTRILRVEHLLAIMAQTGRPKDRARMVQLLDEAKINKHALTNVLKRHGLESKWKELTKAFYDS